MAILRICSLLPHVMGIIQSGHFGAWCVLRRQDEGNTSNLAVYQQTDKERSDPSLDKCSTNITDLEEAFIMLDGTHTAIKTEETTGQERSSDHLQIYKEITETPKAADLFHAHEGTPRSQDSATSSDGLGGTSTRSVTDTERGEVISGLTSPEDFSYVADFEISSHEDGPSLLPSEDPSGDDVSEFQSPPAAVEPAKATHAVVVDVDVVPPVDKVGVDEVSLLETRDPRDAEEQQCVCQVSRSNIKPMSGRTFVVLKVHVEEQLRSMPSALEENEENNSKLASYSSVAIRRLRQSVDGSSSTIEQFLETLLDYSKALHILTPKLKLKDDTKKYLRIDYYPPQAREALRLVRSRLSDSEVAELLKRWALRVTDGMFQGDADNTFTASRRVEQQLLVSELLVEVTGEDAKAQDIIIAAIIECLLLHTNTDTKLGEDLSQGETAATCENLLALSRLLCRLVHIVGPERLGSLTTEPSWIEPLAKLNTRLVSYKQDFPQAIGLILLALPLTEANQYIDNCRDEQVASLIVPSPVRGAHQIQRYNWAASSRDTMQDLALAEHASRVVDRLNINA
ncbi:hypothetical protein FOL47_010064 [Perkinsus chesapeaki]|uniref:Uncharacterized protein n=1 Tax=Perkinsus chesapeaki TaxID=330153 RepID=A0A7J6MQF1_PERCH|nr:hypothetical protein FOL47_010064 [Perkinsus chesapeaki]